MLKEVLFFSRKSKLAGALSCDFFFCENDGVLFVFAFVSMNPAARMTHIPL